MIPPISSWFDNPAMGQRARIVTLPSETGGGSFVREYICRPRMGKFAIPEHFHPTWTETFEILAGKARYSVAGREAVAGAGESIVLPANTRHLHPWSDSDEELHARHTAVAEPADLRGLTASLQGILTIFSLAATGKVNDRGQPPLLQLVVIADATMPATCLPGLPVVMQRAIIATLAAVGRAAGYRASYPEFPQVPG